MKKFIFCRLHESNHGYGFYVSPQHRPGALMDIVKDDFLEARTKKVILQYDAERRIIFGVRQNLPLKDSVGRTRMNFTGYHPNSVEELPYFDSLSKQFISIHEEAMASHAFLEENRWKGEALQDTEIKFDKGSFQKGHPWDEAIQQIKDNPDKSLLKMFDEQGEELHVNSTAIAKLNPKAELKIDKATEPKVEKELKIDSYSLTKGSKKKTVLWGDISATKPTISSIASIENATKRPKQNAVRIVAGIASFGSFIHGGYNYHLASTNAGDEKTERKVDVKRGALATAEILAAVGLGVIAKGR